MDSNAQDFDLSEVWEKDVVAPRRVSVRGGVVRTTDGRRLGDIHLSANKKYFICSHGAYSTLRGAVIAIAETSQIQGTA